MRFKLVETTREQKAKRLFKAPSYMGNKIKTFAIFTAENPNKVKAQRNDNLEYNKTLQRTLRTMTTRGFQYYKVKGKYDNVEHSYIVYNLSLEDAKNICKAFGQQSFIYVLNENGHLSFQFWANQSRSSYSYKKVDEKDTYVDDENFENYYTQISKDFKFNIPFDVFEVAPSEMIEKMETIEQKDSQYSKYLDDNILESIDDSVTSNTRMLARSRLYGKMAKGFNED